MRLKVQQPKPGHLEEDYPKTQCFLKTKDSPVFFANKK